MNRLWNNSVLKNPSGTVRSGWIILFMMAVYYTVSYWMPEGILSLLRVCLLISGDLQPAAGYESDLALWIYNVGLPVLFQVLFEVLTAAVPVLVWKFLMKNRVRDMGFRAGTPGKKEALVGMLLGGVNCTVIFVLVITIGGGRVVSWRPRFSGLILGWIFFFVLVAIAEEAMNRGFFMSTLRRTRSSACILLIPSVIFGLLHLLNPGATFFSILNIVLMGILFSYMYYKSGNLWMCMGYHFAWNALQGVVFGMPVSGMEIPSVLTTQFSRATVLNGGGFGIEGGILTTAVTLVSMAFAWYYYRNSRYDFIRNEIA